MAQLNNPKHEAFCQVYVHDPEVRFNATQSYATVYPRACYEAAAVGGCRLLRKTKHRIQELLEPYSTDTQLKPIVDAVMNALNSKNQRVSLAAAKMGLRLYGYRI
jgi:hypothetical protein